MIREIEHSVQARTNPIFLTGKTAACLMADAGIPDADSIVSRRGLQSGDFGMSDPDMMLGNELVVEAKYRTMYRLIEDTGIQTNVDLPCGYTLRGRLDTITAPELLKAWEAEKVNQEISAIEIDCADLQYISSAGLRVLLMMYKSLENKDSFQMTGITDAVREILETPGFDLFLH